MGAPVLVAEAIDVLSVKLGNEGVVAVGDALLVHFVTPSGSGYLRQRKRAQKNSAPIHTQVQKKK